MMLRNLALKVIASTLAFIAIAGARGRAQTVQPTTHFSVEAGLAAEPPQFSVRSEIGIALAASVGRDLSAHSAVELRLGGELFGAPAQVISPGGCPGQSPSLPCLPPQPSSVHVITLAGNLVLSGGRRATGPLLFVGTGLRYITEVPEHPTDVRPFVEMGGGVAHSFGTASVGLEARYQLVASNPDLPRWMMPIGINVRFF
jgi:hypothetical protein